MANKNLDTVIGRMKEAVGALTGNKGLKRDGRVDQAKGSVKGAVDRVGDAVSSGAASGEQQ
jgi:uncharacterized protein YjbJ (UPF0337 family)